MRSHRVEDWMSREPVTITPDLAIGIAHQMMLLHQVRRLPVLDNRDRLVGIVARSDIREARPQAPSRPTLWEVHHRLATIQAADIMTPSPHTVTPDATILDAANLMLNNKVGGLPVVDEGTLVGIITESDIFRLLIHVLSPEETAALSAEDPGTGD